MRVERGGGTQASFGGSPRMLAGDARLGVEFSLISDGIFFFFFFFFSSGESLCYVAIFPYT